MSPLKMLEMFFLKHRFLGKSEMSFSFDWDLKLTILRGGSKTPATCKMEHLYSNSHLFEATVVNISISRCCRNPRSASGNSILFYYDYTKAILTSLISEFWQ